MKIFSIRQPGQPLKRSEAWGCAALNLLLWPGLGTYVAGRRVGGFVQLGLSAAAVVLAFLGMVELLLVWMRTEDVNFSGKPLYLFLGGFGLFLFIWLWAAISSVFIVRATPPDL